MARSCSDSRLRRNNSYYLA